MSFSDWVGFVGVFLMLGAFFVNVMDFISNDHPLYIILNIIGAGLACYASCLIAYVPFIMMEGTWFAISVWSLAIYFRRDYGKTYGWKMKRKT